MLTKACSNLLRRRRKWPESQVPYKGKWQQTFNQKQAMEALKKAAASEKHHNLLSALINSFTIYACDPTPSAYSFVIKTLSQNSQFDQLPFVLDFIQHMEIPEQIFVDLIKIYGHANRIHDSVQIFFQIPNFRCTPSALSLNALLSVLCKRKQGLQMVHQVLIKSQEMNIWVEESTFRILIYALCKINKIGYAVEILNLMSDYGYHPDSTLYSSILSALCKIKDLSPVNVLGFLEEMRNNGFSPNWMDFTNVISFLVKVGEEMGALDMLNQMKLDRIKPDVVCYTCVLDGVITIGEFHKAEELFDEMLLLGVVPDVHTYNIYIKGLCMQKHFEAGFKLLVCMEELGCKPNVSTYNTLMDALCKVGKWRKAREVTEKMKLKGVQCDSHSYNILINGLICEGEVEEACQYLEDMLSKGFVPTSSTCDEMISSLCKRGFIPEALGLLKQMVERNYTPGANAWEALLSLFKLRLKVSATSAETFSDIFGT